jgi:hypothetical protein
MTTSANGGATTTIALGVDPMLGIAVGANGVYWTGVDGLVERYSPQGGTVATLASVAVDSKNVYWDQRGRLPE